MESPRTAPPLPMRVLEGLERIATAIRADDWNRARAAGVNPTQLAILDVLEGRPAGLAVRDLASQLGVSQPTATDSILALERKGMVEKRPEPGDGRSQRVQITPAGRDAHAARAAAPGAVAQAASALPDDQQEYLLLLVVSVIRQLQESQAIPIQRMCVSCRYFRPYAHADAAKPHHCNFVDAAFGQQDLRIDCREHETADPSVRAATWTAFEGSQPPPPSR
ncbi:MarR family transcriptional regulator [Devosia oryziradicis]|uniref:MarR family transcriptional regulator n=2 Tax=Devosia oryziradicis TaxID=2801335 RepID=A0ABX7BVU4_9HYPH|nr:MarR family transcriptional regulator [Devosia oryziradicis]